MSSETKRGRGRPRLSPNGEKAVLFTMRMPARLRDALKTVPAAVKREMLARAVERARNDGLIEEYTGPGPGRPAETPAGQPQDAQGADLEPGTPQVDESAPGQGKVVQPDRRTAGPADPESLFIE